MQLPDCMARKCPCFCYKMVMGCFTLVFFPLLIFVTSCQASPDTWLTQHLRVEYTEKEFRIYSGCYNLTDELTKWGKRYTYSSFGGPKSTSIGYCVEDSDWVVFEGDSSRDPCDVKESGDGLVAYSAETNDFDVSSTFGIPWWDFSGSPLDLFFETDELETHCDLRILDGMCDPEFNEPGFLYDGGDCCAATCVGSNCGKGQLQSVFGNSNATGDGFPDCANPEMVSVTIQINELTSSRKDVDTTMWFFNNDESLWRNEIPPPLYFSIECNGKLALIVYIEESMVNKSETIKIEDGSSCQIVVKNETDTIDPAETWLKDFPHIKGSDGNASPDPIWYVDYTIFFELDDSIGDGSVEVLSAKSKEDGIVNFTLLPKCFFEELEDQIDTSTFYNTKALEWLAQDDPEISNCGEIEFLERYALLQIDLGFNGTVVEFANRQTHRSWPSIDCDEGMVDALSLKGEGLNGEIRSELGLLTHLKELDISYNNIESIPSEIALLTNLQELRADKIRVNEIPSEIGHLTQLRGLSWHDSGLTELPPEMFLLTILEWFSFYNNEITEVPSEIGRLTRMHYLSVFGNNISKLATDIWQLTDLRFLDFHGNSLGEIPSQIGLLTNLEFCNFDSNGLTELPSEIWSLTTLSRVMWRDNEITELQSNGIKLLTNLERLMLQHNQIAEIPSEIGLLTKLTTLYLHNNQLTSLPTEIGLLTNLQWLFLGENMFTDLPSEIGLLTNVAELNIAGNNFTCDDIMVADGVPCFEEYNYGLS